MAELIYASPNLESCKPHIKFNVYTQVENVAGLQDNYNNKK